MDQPDAKTLCRRAELLWAFFHETLSDDERKEAELIGLKLSRDSLHTTEMQCFKAGLDAPGSELNRLRLELEEREKGDDDWDDNSP